MHDRPTQLYLPEPDQDPAVARAPTPSDWALLVVSAARRRKAIAAGVLLVGLVATAVVYRTKPPLYRVEAKILAQRQQALPSVVRGIYEDLPTRSAWDMIHGRENLVALVRQANLVSAAPATATSAPGLSFLDPFGGQRRPPGDPVDALVTVLDKRLLVTADEGTIGIELDWPDPQQAYDIVRTALQNFLELRYLQEVKSLDEVVAVLEGQAAKLREELDLAADEARKTARAPRTGAPRVRQPSEELVRLESLVQSKQRALQDVEELRRRRVADLQGQLDHARNTLSDAHPTVVQLRKDLDAASRESPQVEALRDEERRIRKQWSERLQREGIPATGLTTAAPSPPYAPSDDDQRLAHARTQYDQMAARVNIAKVEIDSARAAFKYRYSVVWPPQLPREPVSPNPKKIFGLGAIASILLALAAAAAPDLWSRRVLRRWQVERSLELPVLGEIERRP